MRTITLTVSAENQLSVTIATVNIGNYY